MERGTPLRAGDPAHIGPYQVISRLGAGGMGVVFLARDPGGRPVAVKVVHTEMAADDEFRNRFRSEVTRVRQVPPFCTAEVLDADPDAPRPYLVTEFVDGHSLAEEVSQHGPLSASNLHAVAIGVATALTAIHEAGVIHRDLKPHNVLLAPGTPKVIDFGIARAWESTTEHTKTGQIVGTANYMAPERFDESGSPLTPASDVFAWGCVVTYAGTGRAPFHSESPMAIFARILTQEPDLTGLDGPLRPLVERSLHRDPRQRPTARELLDLLLGGSAARVPQLADALEQRPALRTAAIEVQAAPAFTLPTETPPESTFLPSAAPPVFTPSQSAFSPAGGNGGQASAPPYGAQASGPPFGAQPYGAQPSGPPYGDPTSGPPFGGQPSGPPYGGPGTGSPYGGQISGPPYGDPTSGAPFAPAYGTGAPHDAHPTSPYPPTTAMQSGPGYPAPPTFHGAPGGMPPAHGTPAGSYAPTPPPARRGGPGKALIGTVVVVLLLALATGGGILASHAFNSTENERNDAATPAPADADPTEEAPPALEVPKGKSYITDSLTSAGQWNGTYIVDEEESNCDVRDGALRVQRVTPGTYICAGPDAKKVKGDHTIAVTGRIEKPGSCLGIWLFRESARSYQLTACEDAFRLTVDREDGSGYVIREFPLEEELPLNEDLRLQVVVEGDSVRFGHDDLLIGEADLPEGDITEGSAATIGMISAPGDDSPPYAASFNDIEVRTLS